MMRIRSLPTPTESEQFCFYAANAVAAASIFTSFVPHTVFLNEYQKWFTLYKDGFSVSLSKKLLLRFQKALDLLEVKPSEQTLFKPYSTYGFDIRSQGSSYSKYGISIGLPVNFFYETANDVDKTDIKMNCKLNAWESEEGKKLQESLILSENAQLYGIAHEIRLRQTPKIYSDTVLRTSTIISTYFLGRYLNRKFDFYSKPRNVRMTMYILVSFFMYGTYALFKDASQIYYEKNIDKELKAKNEIFSEGGKEYYSKILERNKSLRSLMGRFGELKYSVLGNDNYLLGTKHLPLTDRKKFFEVGEVS